MRTWIKTLLTLAVFAQLVRADSGIFESYTIVNSTYFDCAATTGNDDFDGFNFGTIYSGNSFLLSGGQVKTWKNNNDDITAAALHYRVYLQGESGGSFTSVNLLWAQDLPVPPNNSGDQRWENDTANINLLSGLNAGDYYLEVYLSADYTPGRETHYSNNNGSNYIASFTYDDTDISLTVGDATGAAGTTVTVPLNVVFAEGETYQSVEFRLDDFQSELTYNSYSTTGTLIGTAGWSIAVNDDYNGDSSMLLSFAGSGATDISGSGVLINVLFDIAGGASDGSVPVNLENVIFDNGAHLVNTTGGTVIIDGTAPEYATGYPNISGTSTSSFQVNAKINEAGTSYYVVLTSDNSGITPAQVKAGTDASNNAAPFDGSISLSADTEGSATVSGLTNNTQYWIYSIPEDNYSNLGSTVASNTETTSSSDLSAPIFQNSTPAADARAGGDGFDLTVRLNETGNVYYLILDDGDTAPTVQEVKNAATARAEQAAGTIIVGTAYADATASVTTLTDETAYDLYFVAEDDSPNTNIQNSVTLIEATTADITAPVFISGYPAVSNATSVGFDVDVQLNEIGTAFYLVVADGAAAPSVNDVVSGTGGLADGSIAITAAAATGSATVTGLNSETAYDVYFMAKDDDGNTQTAVVKVDALTTDGTAPAISTLSPAHHSTDVAVDTNLEITFDENIAAGTGNLVIHEYTDWGTGTVSINITSGQVLITGAVLTVNPTADLSTAMKYYITLDDGAIEDLSGNAFSGISDETTWSFTTIPFYGDVDTNGDVRAYDAGQVLKHLASTLPEALDNSQLLNANVTSNTEITAFDATVILRYIVNLVTSLPYSGESRTEGAGGILAAQDQWVYPGSSMEIPVSIDGGTNIFSMEMKIDYDPAVMTLTHITWADNLNGLMREFGSSAEGLTSIVAAGQNANDFEGELAILHFDISSGLDNTAAGLSIQDVRFNEEEIIGDMGTWMIEVVPATGDVNLDDSIDVLDVIEMISTIAGNYQLTAYEAFVGDMNMDGELSVLDVVILVEYIVEFLLRETLNSASVQVTPGSISLEADGDVAGLELNLSGDYNLTAMHIDPDLIVQGPGKLIIIDPAGSSIPEGILFQYEGQLTVESVIIAGWNGSVHENLDWLPEQFGLANPYPNPFNPQVTVSYELPEAAHVRLLVYDILGRQVLSLVDGSKNAGVYSMQVDFKGQSTGIYLIEMRADDFRQIQKVVYAK